MAHVLLIERASGEGDSVHGGLTAEGFTVSTAEDPDLAIKLVTEGDVDLVILDTELSSSDDLRLLRKVHDARPRLPILILSNLDETGPLVIGLGAGASDYITKPISPGKLAARVRARLRDKENETVLEIGPMCLDLAAQRAVIEGKAVELAPREVGLLAAFIRHEGQVLTREDLLSMVWDYDFDPGSNIVSVYVRSLRKKIGDSFIETVPRSGYRLVVPRN